MYVQFTRVLGVIILMLYEIYYVLSLLECIHPANQRLPVVFVAVCRKELEQYLNENFDLVIICEFTVVVAFAG